MRCFFDDRQYAHAPSRELHNGGWANHAEIPARAEIVAARPNGEAPKDSGLDPILAVHDAAYVEFLSTAWDQWQAADRTGDAIGYTFPVVGRRDLLLDRIDAKLGRYSFDAATPITDGTWLAAYWSAQTAMSALDALSGDANQAFALCRPPGHHAGRDYLGGYCYLNNAAIVARAAQAEGYTRIAILDVDYHHGNGTQDIFYRDGSVLFASIHADPRTDYPFYWGHADERGVEEGEGATLNLPLERGTDWRGYEPALGQALEAIAKWGADFLVVSYGADTFTDDPISQFRLERADYTRMAKHIAQIALPTVIVMEGGYAVDALGANVAAFLAGF